MGGIFGTIAAKLDTSMDRRHSPSVRDPSSTGSIARALRPGKAWLILLALAGSIPSPCASRAADLLSRLQSIPSISGYEDSLRAMVLSELPGWCSPRVDALGNLVVDLGGEGPLRLLAAPLDEPGYVITQIDTLGYLRLSRLAGPGRLYDQFHMGQRFLLLSATGSVPAVSAAPSTHLRARNPAATDPWTVADLWLDAGFHSPSEAARAGIRLLDPATLVERYTPLGLTRSAGPGLEARAEVAALLRALQGARPAAKGHWVAAFTAQAQPGGRGLKRLIRQFNPSAVYLLGGFPRAGLGRGVGVQSDSLRGLAGDLAANLARLGGRDIQKESLAYAPDQAGLDALARTPAAVLGLPVRYSRSPAEIVDSGDIAALATFLRRLMEAP